MYLIISTWLSKIAMTSNKNVGWWIPLYENQNIVHKVNIWWVLFGLFSAESCTLYLPTLLIIGYWKLLMNGNISSIVYLNIQRTYICNFWYIGFDV